ncbi:uncharacterized protein MONBRDRAFT_18013 [Monosiga brevicollis MX1]|uniref:GTP 3',8-cyclase n=1 Tax=Monosiga brevicollis TaxID=81824 RepID=A9UTN6_MONBE|nr:uncharacterized protein MONBRDRAFT_18013 [Monosiga brevicollis MX1]EDQ91279.1 predicted protein [Monosiga brevicollis MX1]|eukprot:XP_001743701.1 hypothetical protein [Monosiga brevicollis MX1]
MLAIGTRAASAARRVNSFSASRQHAVHAGLVDRFQRSHDYLRISLTERCNLRCQYCMPEDGIKLTASERLISFEERQQLAALFGRMGVTKFRLTGGEPLVYPRLVEVVESLKALPNTTEVNMTTNGVTLERKLPALKAAGLDGLNISLDTMDPHLFQIITRRKGHDRVLGAIRAAQELGFGAVKVNVVITRGLNDQELLPFVEWTRDNDVDCRFIEYMPFDGNRWNFDKLVTYQDMLETIQTHYPLQRLKEGPNSTSKLWQVDGFRGRIGFITSMTNHFCGSCNRLRLTADGNLKVCLFGSEEVSLRDVLRSGASEEELMSVIGKAVMRKHARHAGMFAIAESNNRPMTTIGG